MPDDAPGPLLEVHEIGSNGMLSGRWYDTGLARLEFPTSVGRLMEAGGGYFCMWRLPD